MIGRRLWRLVLAVALGLCVPMLAAAQDVVEYYGTDAIGSVRIVFDANGAVIGRMDYGPFGEQVTVSTVLPKSYAGLFRDGEAGLDYAEARMYQPRTGRFSSPDPVYAGLFAPQAWNRYSYALNNPVVLVDPTGLHADSGSCKTTFSSGDGPIKVNHSCEGGGGGGGGVGGAGHSTDLSSLWLFLGGLGSQGRGSGVGSAAEPREGPGGGSRAAAVVDRVLHGGECLLPENMCVKLGEIEPGELSLAGVPSGPAAAAAAIAVGKLGEQLVRGVFTIGPKAQAFVNGRFRFPDGSTISRITEIKNVGYQPLTMQLRDYMQIAVDTNRTFDLWVRSSTRISSPLAEAARAGQVRIIPVLPRR